MALKIGLQLYSVREPMAVQPVETLQKILEAGYRYLEPANARAGQDPGIGWGLSAEKLLEILQPYGARVSSAHMGPLDESTLPSIVEYHSTIGNRNIVQAIEFYTGYDHLMRRCEDYNRIGKYLVEHGMNPLLYHNHYHEYQMFRDKPALYHMLENTDPRYVNFEVDTGWVKRAGRDPLEEMRHVGNRLRIIHIKDFAHTPPNLLLGKEEPISWETFGANSQPGDVMHPEDFTELGAGIMNVQEILDTADALGAEYAVLEQDESAKDILESIAISYQNLRTYKNIEL